jgi:small subunit ribosomal protein S27e
MRLLLMKSNPESKFVKVRCPGCKNEQVIFGKAASDVKCVVCGKLIAKSTGGKTAIRARILEVLE